MKTYYAVIRTSSGWDRTTEVLGVYGAYEDARSLLNHVHDQIDHFYASHECYRETCKFLGESWFKASGLRYRKLSQVVHYSGAATTERCVHVDDMKRSIVTLRALFKVHTPAPDWPPEPVESPYEGSKSDYSILTLEVPS